MISIAVPSVVNSLGFTGSRQGLTERQRTLLASIIEETEPSVVVHGGAKGADTEFHNICIRMTVPLIKVYPSCFTHAWGELHESSRTKIIYMDQQPPLDRNWDIVRDRDLVVACPNTAQETLRSGTWATVRYAQQLERTIIVIKPFEDEES